MVETYVSEKPVASIFRSEKYSEDSEHFSEMLVVKKYLG
jgi:hypothetical protein